MLWLFHRKAGTKSVPGGRTFEDDCPTCQDRARFVEVEISEKFGVWFVDVVGDEERAFRCTSCHDVFDLRDSDEETPPPREVPAPVTGMARVEQLAAEQRRRDAAGEAQRAKRETQLDDELAELKRRMGR